LLHLLTLGVLIFQVAILVSVIGLAYLGRRWMNLAALGWVAFTLFGSIYTFGLALLQLITIAVAYGIAQVVVRRRAGAATRAAIESSSAR
jgi:hypothetical protein